MFKKILVCCFTFVCIHHASAQTFAFNEDCRAAYNTILSLKLSAGTTQLKAEQKKNPENLIPLYLENYIDFLFIYTADTRQEFERLKDNKEIRLTQLSEGDNTSPYFLFTQAEVCLQWAAVEIKFGEYLTAIFDIRKAFKLLEENNEKFPDFKPNTKSLGVLYALIGSVPDKYKWGVKLLGLEGNVSKGINSLKELVEYGKKNDFIFHDETVIYYSFLTFHLLSESDRAWQALVDNGFPQKDNLLSVYSCAHIGIYGKHTHEALQILSGKPTNAAFTPFPFLDYLTGLGKLHKLEKGADTYFKQFIVAYKGENHIKSAFQKIAWSYLLNSDTLNYHHFINKADNLGGSMLDGDKQAKSEAENGKLPDVNLLRARLLFDGGYYQQAAELLMKFREASYPTTELKTEYLYRTARIYAELDKADSALVYYSRSIEKGKDLPRYFAASSAFESGKIYEARGDKAKARYCYEQCMDFENHEYKNGLDQKAKAALNRLE